MQLPSGTTVAAKLREAGVILLGESKLSQWANFRSCRPVLPFGGELMVGWGGGMLIPETKSSRLILRARFLPLSVWRIDLFLSFAL
jgi:hypothetical protein